MKFCDDNISIAAEHDAEELTQLLNRAYRGNSSTKGWTTEAHLIDGDVRTSIDEIRQIIALPRSVFLLFKTSGNTICACVNLQKKQCKLYLGMFCVDPDLQNSGIGKKMLQAADEYAVCSGVYGIYMTVISARTELINWYKKYGYAETGQLLPFEEDGLSGRHLQKLEFMVLEKSMFNKPYTLPCQ